MLDCAADRWDSPTLEFTVETGYFWNVYRTSFSIRHGTPRCPSQDCNSHFQVFPKRLFLSVPGTIQEVRNLTDIVGARTVAAAMDGDTASLVIEPNRNYSQTNVAHFRAHPADRSDLLKLEVSSYEFRYDVNTIATVLGLLFGSGLLLEILRRSLWRRKKTGAP